ncbi:MAG: hypothetical protein ACREQJ_12125, partial [Candidatus Binatia bacterium]
GRTMENEEVKLDGREFVGCTFSNVTFRWDGKPFLVRESKIAPNTVNGFKTINRDFLTFLSLLKTLGALEPKFADSVRYFEEPKQGIQP